MIEQSCFANYRITYLRVVTASFQQRRGELLHIVATQRDTLCQTGQLVVSSPHSKSTSDYTTGLPSAYDVRSSADHTSSSTRYIGVLHHRTRLQTRRLWVDKVLSIIIIELTVNTLQQRCSEYLSSIMHVHQFSVIFVLFSLN